jgi:hypothetical protein
LKRGVLYTSHITAYKGNSCKSLLCLSLLSVLLSVLTGCSKPEEYKYITTRLDPFQQKPRIRIGSVVSPLIWTKYIELGQLGKHGYKSGASEANGIIYTCRAGHIDIAHLRNNADWTAHLASIVYDNLRRNNTSFDFKIEGDSIYHVELEYPNNWDQYSPVAKYRVMKDVSIKLGHYFTYIASIWHEVLTWFGYKSHGVYSEFHSAFSWEDNFSNLLGGDLGLLALLDNLHSYDEAMTILLNQAIESLEPQSQEVAKEVTQQLEGEWISSHIVYVEMRKRNFDVGLIDGYVTPITLPFGCEAQDGHTVKIKAPSDDFLYDYGFSMKFEIEPREWERHKILDIIYPEPGSTVECIDPRLHLVTILDYIEKSDSQQYGQDISVP